MFGDDDGDREHGLLGDVRGRAAGMASDTVEQVADRHTDVGDEKCAVVAFREEWQGIRRETITTALETYDLRRLGCFRVVLRK
ncbi:hypothetical protein [Kitasatospora indigofera]|uniref:hypothetical protein n=1 Tax=Kitasatospora indigofera TaxID=67307 RepID=UPI0033BE5182